VGYDVKSNNTVSTMNAQFFVDFIWNIADFTNQNSNDLPVDQ